MQNKEVQIDLQHFEIFIFSSLLSSSLHRKTIEEKLISEFLQFEICVTGNVPFLAKKTSRKLEKDS